MDCADKMPRCIMTIWRQHIDHVLYYIIDLMIRYIEDKN